VPRRSRCTWNLGHGVFAPAQRNSNSKHPRERGLLLAGARAAVPGKPGAPAEGSGRRLELGAGAQLAASRPATPPSVAGGSPKKRDEAAAAAQAPLQHTVPGAVTLTQRRKWKPEISRCVAPVWRRPCWFQEEARQGREEGASGGWNLWM
jgi:hypothetical protein